jgi:hypothetical protein
VCLQIDVEGYEWDVLAALGTEQGWDSALPSQLVVEFHVEHVYWSSPSYNNEKDFSK